MSTTTPSLPKQQPINNELSGDDSYSSYSSDSGTDTDEALPQQIEKVVHEVKSQQPLVPEVKPVVPTKNDVKRERDTLQNVEPPLKKTKGEDVKSTEIVKIETIVSTNPRPTVGGKGPRSMVGNKGVYTGGRSSYGGKTLPPSPSYPYQWSHTLPNNSDDEESDEEEEEEEDGEEGETDEEDETLDQSNSQIIGTTTDSTKGIPQTTPTTTDIKPKKKNSLWTSTIQPPNRKSQRTPEKLIEKFTKKTRKVSCAENACRTFIKKFVSFQPKDIIPLLREIFQILRPTAGVFRSFLNDFEKTNNTTFDFAVADAVQKSKEEKERKRAEKEQKRLDKEKADKEKKQKEKEKTTLAVK